ncbi:MAG: hypothetical protein CK426_06670 [Legionella sp.]|nr:MAG: hypothetical protein CK423_06640 [Legionella sp.]PJD98382.1 MAG: hypothetical protein CK426_06670 [Legionella sp.]
MLFRTNKKQDVNDINPDERVTGVENYTVLMQAIINNDIQTVHRCFRAKPNLELQDREGRTALHLAVIEKNEQAVILLLFLGAQINGVDYDDFTPLMYAAQAGDASLVDTLLDFKADVHYMNYMEQRTALFYAVQSNSLESVSHILAADSQDLNQLDRYGSSPLELAIDEENQAMVSLLIRNGAVVDVTIFQYAIGCGAAGAVELLFSHLPSLSEEVIFSAIETLKARFTEYFQAQPRDDFDYYNAAERMEQGYLAMLNFFYDKGYQLDGVTTSSPSL